MDGLPSAVTGAGQHASASGYCAHLDPVETALLGMLIELQREVERLRGVSEALVQ